MRQAAGAIVSIVCGAGGVVSVFKRDSNAQRPGNGNDIMFNSGEVNSDKEPL